MARELTHECLVKPGAAGFIRQFRRGSAPVAAALIVSGCFHYVPGTYPPPPKPNSEVRIELATPRDIPMGEFTLNEVTMIEGMVAEASADTLALWARWIRPRIGRKFDALGATFYLPQSEVAQLDNWRFSAKRTLIVTGAGVAAIAALIAVVRKTTASNLPGPPPPDNASLVAPR